MPKATKDQLIEENKRMRAALEEIDRQNDDWNLRLLPLTTAQIAARGLGRPIVGGYFPGSTLHGERRHNYCLVYGPDHAIVPGSEMNHKPSVEEIAALRRSIGLKACA